MGRRSLLCSCERGNGQRRVSARKAISKYDLANRRSAGLEQGCSGSGHVPSTTKAELLAPHWHPAPARPRLSTLAHVLQKAERSYGFCP